MIGLYNKKLKVSIFFSLIIVIAAFYQAIAQTSMTHFAALDVLIISVILFVGYQCIFFIIDRIYPDPPLSIDGIPDEKHLILKELRELGKIDVTDELGTLALIDRYRSLVRRNIEPLLDSSLIGDRYFAKEVSKMLLKRLEEIPFLKGGHIFSLKLERLRTLLLRYSE